MANALELCLSCTRKKDVTPLLTHWSYVFLALTHWHFTTNQSNHNNCHAEHISQEIWNRWLSGRLWYLQHTIVLEIPLFTTKTAKWFFSTELSHAVEIIPYGRQGSLHPMHSIPWLLMSWQCKEPGHQQPWHWLNSSRIFIFSTRRIYQPIQWKNMISARILFL